MPVPSRSLRSASAPLLGCLFALASCRSMPDHPRAMYEAVMRDLGGSRAGGFDSEVLERQRERFARIEQWAREGELESAEDYLWSAGALAESDESRQLELAHTLALQAAEMGDARGFTIGAYAEDKILVDAAAPCQRYGTVIVFQPVLERYELYPVDPLTTDAVRHAMGVPSLAELQAQVEALNQEPIAARLRGELVRKEVDGEYPLRTAPEDD